MRLSVHVPSCLSILCALHVPPFILLPTSMLIDQNLYGTSSATQGNLWYWVRRLNRKQQQNWYQQGTRETLLWTEATAPTFSKVPERRYSELRPQHQPFD
jgi:hypothetical protein